MNTDVRQSSKIHWGKALWNSLLVTILSYIAYMIPAFYVAFTMGFELGPKLQDSAEVSRQISQAIPPIYQHSKLLVIGFILVTALLIFWRGRRIAAGTGEKSMINGVLVSTIPVLLTVMFIFTRGFQIRLVIEIVVFLLAGYAGGKIVTTTAQASTPNTTP